MDEDFEDFEDFEDEDDADDFDDTDTPADGVTDSTSVSFDDSEEFFSEDDQIVPETSPESDAVSFRTLNDEIAIDQNTFHIEDTVIRVDHVALLKPLKDARKFTYAGLYTSIKEMGVLTPIVVTPSESYLDWLSEGHSSSEVYSGTRFKVLDGLRRIYACAKLGIEEIPARVVTFQDPEVGAEQSVVFSLILNKFQKKDYQEVWSLMEVLEMQSAMTPATLEWLLNLDPGDAMRLKDVMLCEYPEIIDDFLSKKKTLLQAYNALQKVRKEEGNTTLRDDSRGVADIEGSEDLTADNETSNRLSDSEVKELLELGKDDAPDLDDSAFGEAPTPDEMFGSANEDHVQDTKNREQISREQKTAILRRDEFTCQACGLGRGITSTIQLGTLEAHHMMSVYTGGTDSNDNFVTLCSRCHSMVHILAGFDGKIGMTKEEFLLIPEHDQITIKNWRKYAMIILEAEKKSGKSLKKYKPARLPFWVAQSEAQDITHELVHSDD